MKAIKLFSMAALALAMTACSNSDDFDAQQTAPNASGKLQFTATIAAPADGGMRTTYTEDAGTIKVAWKVDDEIALVHNDVVDKATVKTVNSDGSATIEATITGSPTNDDDVCLAYPYTAVASATAYPPFPFTPSLTCFNKVKAQDGTLTFIQNDIDFRMGLGKLAVSGTDASLKESVKVSSLISIWKLTLQDESSTALNATKVSVNYGGYPQAVASSTPGKSEYYLCVVPSFLPSGDLTIEATVGSDTYIYTKAGGAALAAGKYYQSTVTMTKVPVTDLSMVDCAGNARAAGKMWTANCYMVHTAGNYKLPLVYGNAIKDGDVNTTAFNPGGATTATYCANFVNHNGDVITAPWIKDNSIAVSKAELLWQDAEGLITEVGISGDYLTLTVGKDAATQEGNAVIAVKSGDDIVWSWHIWVTKQTFADASLTSINTGSQTYQVTPVNLGWVGDRVSTGYNTFYQWGRKDAFIPSTGTANTNHTVYDISGTEVTRFTYSAQSVGIKDNIKNPTTFYNDYDGSKGPCTTKYYNMWDAQQTSYGDNIATATKKTVYDPCPPGFCVPTGNLYNYAEGQSSSTTWDDTNKGRTWNGIFFPASGLRMCENTYGKGELSSVGSNGYCWSASPGGSDKGRHLLLHSGNWFWANFERANGYPVRAVAE